MVWPHPSALVTPIRWRLPVAHSQAASLQGESPGLFEETRPVFTVKAAEFGERCHSIAS